MADTPERTVVHVDSAQLHALAHPHRSRLLALLRVHGPATATQLAQRLGTNSGQTSYHLRKLAEVGLVIDDEERGDGRDRWWKAAHRNTQYSSLDFRDDPDDRAADSWLVGYHAREHARWMQDWLDTRDEWPDAWVEAAMLSDSSLRMTAERAAELNRDMIALIDRYRAYEDEPDAVRVTITVHSFPNPEPSV